MSVVLVTGGSGFIAGHVLVQLLQAGHTVRTTVRDMKREADVRALVKAGGVDAAVAESPERLRVFAANLEADARWREAAEGCEFVLHVASPFPAGTPKDENELIRPARDGALRVLKAARDAGVRRVVQTSSFAAIGYGTGARTRAYDERDWTNVDGPGVTSYAKSKTLAERAAWEFIEHEGGGLELATVNPVMVFGPVMNADLATSVALVRWFLDGKIPAVPRIDIGVVDVRDVAALHLKAMTAPEAKGERFLAIAGNSLSLKQMCAVLRERLGERAQRVPTRELPDWVVRIAGLWDRGVRQLGPELGVKKNATSAKAERVLGWKPRSAEEAIVAAAESLFALGVIRGK
ncbi:MAG: aldehyde reductase [Terracidiphilus sp.]|nr:aldehyde reductase [Terracidiphilus sp.]